MGPGAVKDVTVRLVCRDERQRWGALVASRHPLGFRRFAGRGLRYVAEADGKWLALAGWQSATFKCMARDQWIDWSKEQQLRRLHLIANNTRMLVLCAPGSAPNLASHVVAANLRRLSSDWRSIFGHPLELAEAFIDPGH